MSSLLNETTGECISGTCQILDDVPIIVLFLLGFATICLLGWGIPMLIQKYKTQNTQKENHNNGN